MRTAFIDTLTELAAADPRVTLVVGDLGFGVVQKFAQRFPRQFLNAGVAEQNMTGVAAGLALCGKVVFTYSIANFPTLRCIEQIRNDVCYHDAAVIVTAVGGGYAYGALGMTHHATEDLAILRTLPQLAVVAPGDPVETACAVRALAARGGPAYLRLGRAGEQKVHQGDIPFELGKVLSVRQGNDATILSTGGMLLTAMTAANTLASRGVSVSVLSVHTLKPLDAEGIVAAARKTSVVVTLEEHSILGGLGGAVAEILCEAGLDGLAFRRLGLSSAFCKEVGEQDYLRNLHGLSPTAVAETIERLVKQPGSRRSETGSLAEHHA